MKFVKATCPSCGGSLEVAENLASASCPHCGSKIILDWEGQTSLAVHLDLGKTFLQAGNYQEADKHFSLALEKNPRSVEAWFLKGVARITSTRSVDTDKRSLFEEGKAYLQKSGFSKEEMRENLASLMPSSHLIDVVAAIQPYIDQNNPTDVALSELFLLASMNTQLEGRGRELLLKELEQQLETIHLLLVQVAQSKDPAAERKRRRGRFKIECQLARAYLKVLGPDQPNDVVQAKIDWWEKKPIGAKPSYWLGYLNRQEKQYEQKI